MEIQGAVMLAPLELEEGVRLCLPWLPGRLRRPRCPIPSWQLWPGWWELHAAMGGRRHAGGGSAEGSRRR